MPGRSNAWRQSAIASASATWARSRSESRARTPPGCGRRRRAAPSRRPSAGSWREMARVAGAARGDAGDPTSEPVARPLQQRRGGRAESIPGQLRSMVACSATPWSSAGHRGRHRSNASSLSARRSQISSPAAGTTFSASSGRDDRGHDTEPLRTVSAWYSATASAVCASATSALRRWSGALPECEARPVASTRRVPAALRRMTTPSSPDGVRSPASKHQAGVIAAEALGVGELALFATPRR